MNIRIVLLEPEIPQNTGNIARTCAAIGAELVLVEPLGFSLDDRYVKRAGLDYWSHVQIRIIPNIATFNKEFADQPCYYTTARAKLRYDQVSYPDNAAIVFGRESTGIPQDILEAHNEDCIAIPMRENIRSLNLSNSVAIVAYEIMRLHGFSFPPFLPK